MQLSSDQASYAHRSFIQIKKTRQQAAAGQQLHPYMPQQPGSAFLTPALRGDLNGAGARAAAVFDAAAAAAAGLARITAVEPSNSVLPHALQSPLPSEAFRERKRYIQAARASVLPQIMPWHRALR